MDVKSSQINKKGTQCIEVRKFFIFKSLNIQHKTEYKNEKLFIY